jgi:RNA polymerase sigma-70 factor (ECF subfamily)
VAGWLVRAGVRAGLDELRKQSRRDKYESIFGRFVAECPTPEQKHVDTENQHRVRVVLSALKPDQTALLVLRSEGCSYQEMAEALGCNPASIGSLLGRAQQAFRKEYTKRYGQR